MNRHALVLALGLSLGARPIQAQQIAHVSYVSAASVLVRDAPSLDAPVSRRLRRGAAVCVISAADGWARIRLRDPGENRDRKYDAFVASGFLTDSPFDGSARPERGVAAPCARNLSNEARDTAASPAAIVRRRAVSVLASPPPLVDEAGLCEDCDLQLTHELRSLLTAEEQVFSSLGRYTSSIDSLPSTWRPPETVRIALRAHGSAWSAIARKSGHSCGIGVNTPNPFDESVGSGIVSCSPSRQ